jgi:hypothetical protein
MAEFISKLSSSATSWVYKSATGFENSTEFGTGSGNTHQFTGSIFTTGSQTIQVTGDLTWFNDAGLGTPESVASSVSPPIDRYIIGERAVYAISGAIEISSTDYILDASQIIIDRSQQRSLALEANNNIQLTGSTIEVTGSIYADDNIYNSLLKTTATSITASAGDAFLAISASGPTSVLLPPAEERLELTIADVSGSAGTNAITINASGSNKIQGASSLEISSNYGTVTFIAYDSTNWHIKSTN